MIWFVIGAVVFVGIVVTAAMCIRWVAVDATEDVAAATEEKGPMPKNHGGFGQRVTGGKS
jgi:hypothetical protein